jgi:hypothetical protein
MAGDNMESISLIAFSFVYYHKMIFLDIFLPGSTSPTTVFGLEARTSL